MLAAGCPETTPLARSLDDKALAEAGKRMLAAMAGDGEGKGGSAAVLRYGRSPVREAQLYCHALLTLQGCCLSRVPRSELNRTLHHLIGVANGTSTVAPAAFGERTARAAPGVPSQPTPSATSAVAVADGATAASEEAAATTTTTTALDGAQAGAAAVPHGPVAQDA